MNRITNTSTPFTTVIRLLGVVQNPANGFPARPLAAIAARNDWFHDDDGIHEAVELLATGQSPEITGDIHQALAQSSELGHDLTSAFSAAMAQPDLVKFGMGYDSANGSDEDARSFARRTIQLADRLTAERRATA